MSLVRFALRNPYLVTVVSLLFVVTGLVSLIRVPVDILPAFKSPGVIVMTFYSGMPASAIDRNITSRMERWCGQATGVSKIESKSMVGISIVRLLFRDDIDQAAALTEVNSLALSTLKTLPPGTLPPIVRPFDPTATLPLCILSVGSKTDQFPESELQDLARVDLRNQLGGLPGVIAPAAFGGRERAVMVYLRPEDMEARQISPLDVVRSLRQYNSMLSAGTAKFGDEEVQLESSAIIGRVEDYNEIPVKSVDERQIYLRDIGEAVDASRIQTSLVRIDGKPQVYVPVYRQQGSSSVAVVDEVRSALPLMRQRAPEGIDLDVVMDQSVYVRQAIKSLVEEGILGAILAAGMILLFLGDWRSTVIAVVTIPLAMMAAVAALYATGNTVNAMTLGGLALAIGPLVDLAIVVLENTHRHLAMGKSVAEAALVGAGEVAQPVVVATLSTITVLVPLAFMPGMGRFLFRPLALAVAFAMLASLLLSLTLVPSRSALWLRVHSAPSRWHGRFNALMHGLTIRYEQVLRAVLQVRFAVLAMVTILFFGSFSLMLGIGREFFPLVDTGQLTVFARFPTGTKLEKSNERLDRLEAFLRDTIAAEDLRMMIAEVGVTTNWSAAYTANSGPQDATLKIQLSDARTKTAQEYASLIRSKFQQRQEEDAEFADLRISIDTGGMVAAALNFGAVSPIEVQVVGGKAHEAMEIAHTVRDTIASIPGAVDVRVQQRHDYPQMLIDIDRKKAQLLGVDVFDVFHTTTTALNSSVTVDRNFWLDPESGNQYFIGVQYPEKSEITLDEIKSMSVTARNTREVIKLGTLVDFQRTESGPAEINHDNLANVISVLVAAEGRDIGSLSRAIQTKLADLRLPRGMILRFSGEYERMNESFANLGFGFVLATVLVYLVMVAQFRSYLSPFIIMFSVPLGLIGVLVALFATGTTLNIQSCMGIIFMAGIVVANSTLLIDFANRMLESGSPVQEAIVSAACIRLRPILMTFLATFLALMPMAVGMGKGSEANIPLARAVVGGLLASTCLTLFVVPILFTLFHADQPREPLKEGEPT